MIIILLTTTIIYVFFMFLGFSMFFIYANCANI